MRKATINKIMGKLPHELAEYVVRDVSFLSCTIFNQTHLTSFKKFFNFNKFTIVLWFGRNDGQVTFYRSGKEYALFSETLGKRYLKNINYAKRTAETLMKMTDEINAFTKENESLEKLQGRWDKFYQMYRDFFSFHQAIYWPSEYLLKIKMGKENIDEIIKVLDKAYKYNEHVVPNVESYFNKLGIRDVACDEMGKAFLNKKNERRSTLLLNKKITALSFKDASEIDAAIKESYQAYLGKFKGVKGQGVSRGKARGKVKLIIDLSRLKECRKGDILVTPQTRPQYNSFIKNVSAIVTDEGGMLCHASMLAREFKIPCIVGTKNATKMLKDGDLVEVNADKGVIKKVK